MNDTKPTQGNHDSHTVPDSTGTLITVAADTALDVRKRLSQMREWHAEWERQDSVLKMRQNELDVARALDRQLAYQIERERKRLDMLRLRSPLELSPTALQGDNAYAALRTNLRTQFASLTRADRLLWLDNLLYIITPDLRRLDDKITDVRRFRSIGQRRNFLLGGPSGMGKTSYCNYLVASHPPTVEGEHNRVPILKIDAPVGGLTARALLQRLILECGMTHVARDTEEDLLIKLVVYLARCEVEIIIVDECEHISSPPLRRRLLEISNLTHGIPIICASCLPHKWTEGDVEVRGRWNDYFQLQPYVGDRLDDLLLYLELLLPFPEESYLDLREVPTIKGGRATSLKQGPAHHIQQWTGGILREIMVLLWDASRRAIWQGMPALTAELLSETWAGIRSEALPSHKQPRERG